MRPLVSALRFLTILPIPGKDTQKFESALIWFPCVGALLGFFVLAIRYVLLWFHQPDPFFSALISIITISILTGMLHLDGIADVADAFGGGRDVQQRLEILKDSRLGTYGVCTLIFVLAGKLYCWYMLISCKQEMVIVYSLVVSRAMQPLFIAFVPNCRKQESKAAIFSSLSLVQKILLCSVACVCCVSGCFLSVHFCLISTGVLVVSLSMWIVQCMRLLKGVTGDCIGAGSEITELSVVLCGALFLCR